MLRSNSGGVVDSHYREDWRSFPNGILQYAQFAVVNPEKWFEKRVPIRRRRLLPQNAMDYYTDAKNLWYFTDPDKISRERLVLAQKFGYQLLKIEDDADYEMLAQMKGPRHIFLWIESGWVLSLKDRATINAKGSYSYSMADNETLLFLNNHGLERLAEAFMREEIKLTDFQFLRDHPEFLQQLLPRLRDRIDFLKATAENVTKGVQADLQPPIICRETLREICSRYDDGRIFLHTYKNENGKRIYPPESRNNLKKAIVEHFFTMTRGHITHNHFMEMVTTILNELPDEDARTWYIPALQKRSAGGLLHTRYRYLLQIDKRFRPSAIDHPKQEPVRTHLATWDTMDSTNRAVSQGAKEKLKTIGYSDSDNISECWKVSFAVRRNEALNGRISFDDWDVLAHFENVHELINYDFREIHSESNDCLSQHIPNFILKFRNVFNGYRNFIEEDKILTEAIIAMFVDNIDINDRTVFMAFYALPLMLRQQFAIVEKKRFKVSIHACRESFITLLETEAKIVETVERRRRVAKHEKTTIQPFVIVIGTISQPTAFFVILDNLILKCRSMIAAIDLHFKLHSVFHIQYAKQCEVVMNFIQKFFYKVTYADEREEAAAITLMSDFRRL